VRQQECVEVRKDLAGLLYEYVSTKKSLSQGKCYMPKKSKKRISLLFNNYLANRLLREFKTQQKCRLFNLDISFRIEI